MNEENTPGELDEVTTEIRLVSAEEGVNIADAKQVRLEVTGETQIVSALFEVVLMFAQGIGGVVERAMNDRGEDITSQFRPAVIDPLDLGDDPVA